MLSELLDLVVVTFNSERGLLLTLGAGGISVQAQRPLSIGSKFTAQFRLPLSEAAINPSCEVVWISDNCDSGLRFLSLEDSERRALNDWLVAQGGEPGASPSALVQLKATSPAVPDDVPISPTFAELTTSLQKLMSPAAPACGTEVAQAPSPAKSENLEQLLPRIVAEANSVTAAEGAALVLHGTEGLVCRASIGNAPAVGSRMRPGSGLSGECFRLGQVVHCDDVEKDPRVNSAAAHRLQSRSIVIMPIKVEGSTRGLLQVLSSRPSAFNAAHIETLEQLAAKVGSRLASDEKQGQLEPAISVAPPLDSQPGLADSALPYASAASRAHDSLLYPDLH